MLLKLRKFLFRILEIILLMLQLLECGLRSFTIEILNLKDDSRPGATKKKDWIWRTVSFTWWKLKSNFMKNQDSSITNFKLGQTVTDESLSTSNVQIDTSINRGTWSVILLHDNARIHTATFNFFNLEYSPD